ncbi:tautomerase family protein [uncultured Roseibium sp.]|uniref:tautomerase family protein n=1 Tax=uncultured Roseibium sp. TaxID=1936171 RepID=UPI0026117D38|nr:tautomerase family protein [uncultured Roseibium sp.]
MPIVELHVLEGYGPDEKRRLHEALTDAVRLVVPANPDAITVMIHELTPANYSRGGKHRKGAPALGDAGEIVRAFLQAMEAREIETARAFLAEQFAMYFPGAQPMFDLEALIEWAKQRYRFVKKTYLGFDVMQSSGPEVLVYCHGTLSGEWLGGTSFESIRFIDRFELVDGKIYRQDVWNDIAEVKAGL